jgi:hypothetical protein
MAEAGRSPITHRGVAAVVPALTADLAAPAVATPSRLQHLEAEILAVGRLTAELNARDDATEEEWSAWCKREGALVREIHALPATAENARLKAQGILQIYNGDLNDWGGGDLAADLARQIVGALASDA